MSTPSRDALWAALARVVQDGVEEGRDVVVPGLGCFRIDHRPAAVERDADGRLVVTPPENTIAFTPSNDLDAL